MEPHRRRLCVSETSSSAPPTESESNILKAFEAGWGGVVTKTIGMHPVANVAGAKTKVINLSILIKR